MGFGRLFLVLSLLGSLNAGCRDSETGKWFDNENQEQCTNSDRRNHDGQTDKSTLRIILVGKTRAGRSSTGNTILGEKLFASKSGMKSVTKVCSKKRRDWRGRELVVVDTPGMFDPSLSPLETSIETSRCIVLSSPGPHAIVLVLRLGHYTQEERETVAAILEMFGKEALRYMIVLFTHKDELDSESIQDFLKRSENKDLQELLAACENRFCAFNNKAEDREREEQVSELFAMIDRMVAENGGSYFTNKIYIMMEMGIKKRVEELRIYYKEHLNQEAETLKQMEEKFETLQETIKANEKKLRQMAGQQARLLEEEQKALHLELRNLKNIMKEMKKMKQEKNLWYWEQAEEMVMDSIWDILPQLLPHFPSDFQSFLQSSKWD